MKGEVICVIDEILHKLSMEEEQFKEQVNSLNNSKENDNKTNFLFSKFVERASLVTSLEKEKNSRCNLNTSNSLNNKNENSVNADTSSGFGDSTALKTFNNDSVTKIESIAYFQVQNEITEIRDPEISDFNTQNIDKACRIFTSTPKKINEIKDILTKNSINSINNNTEKNFSFTYNENAECLNQTIEEAISKYEKETEAIKMEDAFVQTSFEKSTSMCGCKVHMPEMKANELPTRILNDEPPLKKARIEIDSKTSDNANKEIHKFEAQQSNTKSMVTIPTILNLSPKENNEINKNEEKNNFCKIPRIRVGLSKRAKIRPLI